MGANSALRLLVHDPVQAMEFLSTKLGFTTLPVSGDYLNNKEILASDKQGNLYVLVRATKQNMPGRTANDRLNIIETSDCVRDYFLLGTQGISFDISPTYLKDALIVRLTDSWGNRYLLRERRQLNDD